MITDLRNNPYVHRALPPCVHTPTRDLACPSPHQHCRSLLPLTSGGISFTLNNPIFLSKPRLYTSSPVPGPTGSHYPPGGCVSDHDFTTTCLLCKIPPGAGQAEIFPKVSEMPRAFSAGLSCRKRESHAYRASQLASIRVFTGSFKQLSSARANIDSSPRFY